VREKLPNYILGLAMSRLLKWRELLFFFNQWWVETLARAAQILHSRTSCGKGTAKSSPKSLKKSSSNSSKKVRFWMVRPWHMQPNWMRKGNSELLFIQIQKTNSWALKNTINNLICNFCSLLVWRPCSEWLIYLIKRGRTQKSELHQKIIKVHKFLFFFNNLICNFCSLLVWRPCSEWLI